MEAMKALRIKSWEKHYENNRSRELKRPEWLPLPNKFDGTGFMELMDHPAGMSHYGAWCLLLGAASRQPVRGLFVTDSGKAMTIKDIARMTRGSAKGFEEALPRLLAIGWVEEVEIEEAVSADSKGCNASPAVSGEDAESQDDAEKSQPSAGIPQRGATMVRLNGKGNGKENMNAAAAALSRASEPPPPLDPCAEIERANAQPAQVHRGRNWRDWQITVGIRCFVGKDESDAWAALYQAEGWDEMTRAYVYLAKTKTGKLFLSDFQACREDDSNAK
jgi:hypothetical protein